MKYAWMNKVHNALLEIFPEARRVGFGKAYILVQVKECSLSPINIWLADKHVEKFKLGSAGSSNQVGAAMFGDCLADDFRSIIRRRLAQLLFGPENPDIHSLFSELAVRQTRFLTLPRDHQERQTEF